MNGPFTYVSFEPSIGVASGAKLAGNGLEGPILACSHRAAVRLEFVVVPDPCLHLEALTERVIEEGVSACNRRVAPYAAAITSFDRSEKSGEATCRTPLLGKSRTLRRNSTKSSSLYLSKCTPARSKYLNTLGSAFLGQFL